MKYYGYQGKILRVDLSSRRIWEEDINLDMTHEYLGDQGLSARLAWDYLKPGVDAFSPENPIIIGAGPLAGTSVPAAGRFQAVCKLPETGAVCYAGGSMGFGGKIKNAGFDVVIIMGKADRPCYLKIHSDGSEICDATDLWGKDLYEATNMLWKRHGRMTGVITIGLAGENLVKISFALVDKSSSLGARGLAAVMGSKNLKAITADGNRGVRVADPPRFRKLVDEILDDMRSWPSRERFIDLGHMEFDFDSLVRIVSIIDCHSQVPDLAFLKTILGPEVYKQRAKKYRVACPSCVIGCRDIMEIKGGPLKGERLHAQSFLHSHAARCGVQSIDELLELNLNMQLAGIDRTSFVCLADHLVYMAKRDIILKEDIEGLEMNVPSLVKMIWKVAHRQGIGDAIADGLDGLKRRFGPDIEKHGVYSKAISQYADPRTGKLGTNQFVQIIDKSGAHGKGGMVNPGKFEAGAGLEKFINFGKYVAIPEYAMSKIIGPPYTVNMARMSKYTQILYTVFSSLGLCIRFHIASNFYPFSRIAELYSAATGYEMEENQLRIAAERTVNLMKLLNVREGFSRKDDQFPARWLEPIKAGDEELKLRDYFGNYLDAEDLQSLLDDYYDEMGWDVTTGTPTLDKIKELGLDFTIPCLKSRVNLKRA